MKSSPIFLREFTESVVFNQNIDMLLDCVETSMDLILNDDSLFGNLPFIRSIRLLGRAGISIQRGFEIKNSRIILSCTR